MNCPYCNAEMPQSDRAHVLGCRVEFEQNLPQRPEMYVDHHGWKRIKPGQETETVRYIEYLERGPCCRKPWCGGNCTCEVCDPELALRDLQAEMDSLNDPPAPDESDVCPHGHGFDTTCSICDTEPAT